MYNPFNIISSFRLSFLPPLMIYLAAGVSGLTNIVGLFFVKEYLDLSASFLAGLGFWAGLPWVLKMPLGHIVDLIWKFKSILVFFGAFIMTISSLIMYSLIAHKEEMISVLNAETWFIISTLLAPIGFVLQDVVADALTVEAIPKTDEKGNEIDFKTLKSLNVVMQLLGRVSIILGTLIGVIAGYFKKLDGILMRFTDLFLSLPLLPLLLLMMFLFREPLSVSYGPEKGMFILIVFAIGVTSWMPTARIVRGDVLALKQREFVMAARSIGTPDQKIILRHILPNILSPILVSATLGIANAIITESALSFLGLGFPPDFPTWGRLLNDAVDYLQLHPERVMWPGLAISLTVLSINFLGDGLRDALDPRIRGR